MNENSLVVLLQYRTLRALFMGDAGFQSEERLLAQGVDLRASLLKVGPHGSAYSSSIAFIAAVHPSVALISVGRHNLFGHPAPTTLEVLRSHGASIFRTDLCGAVTIALGATAQPSAKSILPCFPNGRSRKRLKQEQPLYPALKSRFGYTCSARADHQRPQNDVQH